MIPVTQAAAIHIRGSNQSLKSLEEWTQKSDIERLTNEMALANDMIIYLEDVS